jgi:hypothetical protein
MRDEIWRETEGEITRRPHHLDKISSDREWDGEQHKKMETSLWWFRWRWCGSEDVLPVTVDGKRE